MPESAPRRKLAAILAADVVGFSKLMGENEDRTLRNLKACRSLTDESIATYHGRIFGSAGDSVIAEFASVRWTRSWRLLSFRETCVTAMRERLQKTGCSFAWDSTLGT